MNAIEQLEALNPVPDYRGNPGRAGRDTRRPKVWVGAALAAAAILVVVAGAFALRSANRTELDLEVAAQTEQRQPQENSPVLAQPGAATDLDGSALARLVVPEIDIDVIVVEGVGTEALRRGPGHYPGTPLPGQEGNAAIAGHRTTYGAPFHRLDELDPGDSVFVTTAQGTFEYQIVETAIVDPDNTRVLEDAGNNRLTLTSGHPKYSNRERIVVVAELVGVPATTIGIEDLPPIVLEASQRSGLIEVPVLTGDRLLGSLVIPAVAVDVRVLEGVAGGGVRRGPEHYVDTPMPGQAGNSAIFGHRRTFGSPFERLDELQEGDVIIATTLQGAFEYEVSEIRIVGNDDTTLLQDFGDDRLTLVSEHPKDSASERIVVVADLMSEPAPTVTFDNLPRAAQVVQTDVSNAPDLAEDRLRDGRQPYFSFHGNTDVLQSAQSFLIGHFHSAAVRVAVHEQTLRSASVRWVDDEHDTAGWIVLTFADGRYWVEDMTTDGIVVDMSQALDGGGVGFVQSERAIMAEVDRPVKIWLDPNQPVRTAGPLVTDARPLVVENVDAEGRVEISFDPVADSFQEVRFTFRNADGEQIGAAISSLSQPIFRGVEIVTSVDKVEPLQAYLRDHLEFVNDWFTFDRWESVERLMLNAPELVPLTVAELPGYQVTRLTLAITQDDTQSFVEELFAQFHEGPDLFTDEPTQSASVDVSAPASGYVVDELPSPSACVFPTTSSAASITVNEVRNVASTPLEAIRLAPLALDAAVIEFTTADGTVLGYAQAFDGRPWTFRQVIAVEEVEGGWVVDRWETTGC